MTKRNAEFETTGDREALIKKKVGPFYGEI